MLDNKTMIPNFENCFKTPSVTALSLSILTETSPVGSIGLRREILSARVAALAEDHLEAVEFFSGEVPDVGNFVVPVHSPADGPFVKENAVSGGFFGTFIALNGESVTVKPLPPRDGAVVAYR